MRRVGRQHRAGGLRLVATLALCTFAAGNLTNLVHYATVAHGVCPEHGEAVHLRAHGHGAFDLRDLRAESGVAGEGRAALAAETSAAEHEHEHCFICPTSREMATATAQSAPVVVHHRDLIADDLPVAQVVRAPQVPLYLLAPKQSPPVLA
ncbi:MAG: hypothetical protein KC620_09570 [Myxococcales bacterium]|nr:hypothetical protein [Myxococcales bacterium]